MKKRIASIFLGALLAVSSACASQPQQTAQTASATYSVSETTTAASLASEAQTGSSEKDTDAADDTKAASASSEDTEEITEPPLSETTTALTEAETTTASTEAETTTASTEAETTTAQTTASTEAATEKSAAETTQTTTTTEETQMTQPQQNEPKIIALTFDDGPNTTTTNEVLDVLERYGIRASFFLVGNNINSESAKAVKRAYDMGCEIGNHSLTHSYMDKMSVDEIISEIEETNKRIEEITGEEPKFFRPPYISVSKDMTENIDMTFIAGYGANDWVEKYTAEHRAKLVIRQARDGGIILLHDSAGNSQTVQALDIIIPELQAQGYEFVTVSEVFEKKGITPELHSGKIYSYSEQVGEYS